MRNSSFGTSNSIGRNIILLVPGLLLVATLTSVGCGPKGPPRKATYPVKGKVTVDGKPVEGIMVQLHDTKGMDPKMPTFTSAMTTATGEFSFSTYAQSDGVPEGTYALTFYWGQMNVLTMDYGGPDKLKDRYRNKDNAKFEVTVEGKPMDLGEIALTTK